MTTITMNRGDWSGREITVRVTKDGTFTVDGDKYRMVKLNDEHYEVRSEQHRWEVVGNVYRMGKGEWMATSSFCDLTRSSMEPIKAAISVICNT